MKMIHVELSGKFFIPKIVEAEKIGIMWRITKDDGGRRVPYKCRPEKLIPYSDEIWEEVASIRAGMKALWQRKLALRKFAVREE